MGVLDWLAGKLDPEEGQPMEPPKDAHSPTFTDMIRGFQHCVERAQEVSERHSIEIIDRFFVEEKDEKTGIVKQRPRMITFEVMKGFWMHYPLICMVEPNTLRLSEMEIEMAMKITKQTIKKASKDEQAANDKTTRASFEVEFTSMKETNGEGKQNAMRVKMKFVAPKEQPEGLLRIIDEYRKSVGTLPKGDPPPPGQNIAMNGHSDTGPGGEATETKKGEGETAPSPEPPAVTPPPAELG